MLTSEIVQTDFAQAQDAYERAIEAVHYYCVLCHNYDWENAEAVRDSLLIYLEVSLDAIAHAHKTRELADG